jgi:hypothetical protein
MTHERCECVGARVPSSPLLRKIDAVIDFSFIHDLTETLYCADNGRPPLDPTLIFKALFIGYLFGIGSERQLVREIEVRRRPSRADCTNPSPMIASRIFYRCLQGQVLAYSSTDRGGHRHYKSDPACHRSCKFP